MAERLLNFAHTGSARVLPSALLNELFPLRAISDGYMPMFNDNLTFPDLSNRPVFPIGQWPTNKVSNKPLVASKRVQELTYGKNQFAVSAHPSDDLVS